MKTINWKIFLILWLAEILALIAILPYTLAMQSSLLAQLKLPLPLPLILTIQVVQNAILFAVLTALGLYFAKRIGLGTPILEARLAGEPVWERVRAFLPVSILIGVVASLLIIGLDLFVFQPAMLRQFSDLSSRLNLQTGQPAAWKGFLASFYGGIVEEVLLRLFVMSFLAWLGSLLSKTAEGRPTAAVFWLANILAAILFGLGHLPATAQILPLTALVVTRAVILNGVAGIGFGYLYWTRGLESAMVSHFSADIVLHVLLAL